MQLVAIDWAIIVAYFTVTLLIGVAFTRRAGSSLDEFFVSGRALPWWVAGTSMVATTFAADTPLAVTALIVKNGLAGNWFWWAFALGGMLTVFVYARLWRRAEVMTDVELIRMRYQGPAAEALRYLRSVYVALLVNPIIIGWVVGAMLTILEHTVFFSESAPPEIAGVAWDSRAWAWLAVAIMLIVTGVYCTLAGMWGVALADAFQFCLAMLGCILLAVVAVRHCGGVDALVDRVQENYRYPGTAAATPYRSPQSAPSARQPRDEMRSALDEPPGAPRPLVDWDGPFAYLPSFRGENRWMPLHIFLIMLTVQWWASWYPGAEPGGGGYVVQRMAACQNERHSVLATLWYQLAHYCVRPWPWIMIAFCALALYPDLRAQYLAQPPDHSSSFDPGIGFPRVMRELSPPGLAGLMLVAFFAAFMSTISTQMNWGASYLVRDFLQPLFLPHASDAVLTRWSRGASLLILGFGFVAAWLMKQQGISVDQAWKLLAALGAGTGLVFMLRWFWWRINAWTEISAMLASLVFFVALGHPVVQARCLGGYRLAEEERLALVAGLTILTWLAVMWLTRPEPEGVLREFYRRVRPGGPGWGPIARLEPQVHAEQHLGWELLGALFGAGLIFCTLPAIGALIFRQWALAATGLAAAAGCGLGVVWITKKIFAET